MSKTSSEIIINGIIDEIILLKKLEARSDSPTERGQYFQAGIATGYNQAIDDVINLLVDSNQSPECSHCYGSIAKHDVGCISHEFKGDKVVPD
jgi:hypothetical protein